MLKGSNGYELQLIVHDKVLEKYLVDGSQLVDLSFEEYPISENVKRVDFLIPTTKMV